MAKRFTYIHRKQLGSIGEHEAIVTLPSGKRYYIPAIPYRVVAAGESAIYDLIEKELKEFGVNIRYAATVKRTPTYADLSKNKRKESQYTRRELKKIADNIGLVTQVTAHAIRKKTLFEIAEEGLSQAVNSAEFNEYTGNLYNSYNAVVISNGKVTHSFGPSPTHEGSIGYGGRRKRGVWIKTGNSRYSPLRIQRHAPSKQGPRMSGMGKNGSRKSGNGLRIRFLKSYEKNPSKFGYRDLALGISNMPYLHGLLKVGGTRDYRIKSGIIIQNTAPYSGAVQMRYNVLRQASIRGLASKYTSNGTQLMRVITKRALKQAGFNVK